LISSPHRSRGAPAVPTPRPQSCGATAALLPGSIVDRCLSDLGAPGFDGRIERCPVGNIEWCEDFRGNAVSGRQAGLEFHRRASSSGHDRYPRGRAQGALTLCLLFTGTMADAETADLQAGGKSPLHGQNHGRLRLPCPRCHCLTEAYPPRPRPSLWPEPWRPRRLPLIATVIPSITGRKRGSAQFRGSTVAVLVRDNRADERWSASRHRRPNEHRRAMAGVLMHSLGLDQREFFRSK
jgi:hypothetical protein